ncbi:short-chain dehydrogenases/reductase [Penicillium waksmanii]|uniref:short-chain dehydrogenases/reductase n=1 Tax=Penicillium waksmanii TaxID=69791 RepID=UPI002549A9A9|nr:short-chain dehydrogenases/reductase [Penicillium waksmanii]KAJ5995582.1 short-chain dehydrogenases/reductase [Penicillium waksmanii]
MPGPVFILRGKVFPPKQITTTFEGKTIIVTGSNTGVGYATALKYVQHAASTVILGVRSLQKGEKAKEQIEKATGRAGVVQVWQLDMASFEGIDAFAKRVETLKKVDVAVLNAGIMSRNFKLSKKGWENNLQVNTLGTALLAILLTPKLQASPSADSPAHIVVVTSTGHIDAQLKPQDKSQLLHKYNSDLGVGLYQQHVASKLFMMWITRELAYRCLDANGEPTVIVNDACPGACRSDVAREFDSTLWAIAKGIGSFLIMRPAENGARVLVGASTLGKDSHGRWWSADGNYRPPGGYITSDEGKILQKALWTEVVDVLEENIPRVKDVIASLSERRVV